MASALRHQTFAARAKNWAIKEQLRGRPGETHERLCGVGSNISDPASEAGRLELSAIRSDRFRPTFGVWTESTSDLAYRGGSSPLSATLPTRRAGLRGKCVSRPPQSLRDPPCSAARKQHQHNSFSKPGGCDAEIRPLANWKNVSIRFNPPRCKELLYNRGAPRRSAR